MYLFRCVYSGVSSQGGYSFNHPTPCQGWPLLSLFIVSGLLCVCLSGRLTLIYLTPWCAIHSFKSRWCGIHSFNSLVYFLFIRPTWNDWCIIQVCCSFTQVSGILFHAFHSLLCCSCIQLNCLVYYSFMELPRVVYIHPTPWEWLVYYSARRGWQGRKGGNWHDPFQGQLPRVLHDWVLLCTHGVHSFLFEFLFLFPFSISFFSYFSFIFSIVSRETTPRVLPDLSPAPRCFPFPFFFVRRRKHPFSVLGCITSLSLALSIYLYLSLIIYIFEKMMIFSCVNLGNFYRFFHK